MFSRSSDPQRSLNTASTATSPVTGPKPISPASELAKLAPATPATPAGSPFGRATEVATDAPKVSVIGNDLTILGQDITIISKGTIQLDGAIQGSLHGTEIHVGEKGRVDGTIAAERVVIRGTVNGTIRALNVSLQEGARVDGEILHQSLALDAKAHFEGRARRPQNTDELRPNLDPAAHDKKSGQG